MRKLYQKLLTLGLMSLLFFTTSNLMGQNAWINEVHYDNASGDVDEAIEIVLEDAGSYTLSDFTISLYNGSDNELYGSNDTFTLDQFTVGASSNGFTVYSFLVTTGLQNGSPDGISLDYQGTVLQFISYEGVISPAGDGPAIGQTSEDIGVEETGTTAIGESLQLSGSGSTYTDFVWQAPAVATIGALNTGQTLVAPCTPPTTQASASGATVDSDTQITVDWTRGNGTAGVVVLAKEGAAVDATPESGTTYTADAAFGSGDVIGTGNNVVYVGTGTSVAVTGLNIGTEYHFEVFEYNTTDVCYLTPGATATATTTGNAIPEVSSVATAVGETTNDVVLTFSEVVNATDETGISITIGGTAATINSVAGINTDTWTFTLAETITANSGDILISYDDTAGDLADAGAAAVASFTDLAVTNNTTLNVVADIEAARALSSGDLVQITGEVIISFIRDNDDEIYVQDATRGIVIVDDNNQVNTVYNVGEGVTGIKGTLNQGFTGVLEFIPTADLGAATSTGATIIPDVVTITEFNANFANYESRIISIEEVGFANAGTAFDAGGDNYNIGKDGDSLVFRDNFYDFRYEADVTIPYGRRDIIGVAGQFQGDAQIVPNSTTESIIDNYSPVTDEAAVVSNITTGGFDVNIGFDEPAKVFYLVNTTATATQGDVLASTDNVIQSDPTTTALISLSGLTDNTQYYVHMVAADTDDSNPQATVTTVDATTLEIVFDETSTIEAADAPIGAAVISSVAATEEANAVEAFNFKITDDAAADAVPTVISSMVIENANATAWSSVIAGAKITDGVTTATATTITDSEIVFSPTTAIEVANGTSSTFTLSVWFNTTVEDGTAIQFTIPTAHSFVADNTGSALVTTLAAAVSSAEHTINVEATDLVTTGVPTSVEVDAAFGFTVSAEDANGNLDTEARSLTLSTATTGVLSGTITSVAMTNGEVTFSDLSFDSEGSLVIDITDGVLTSSTSAINVTAVATGTLFISEYIEGSSNNKAIEIYNGTGVEADLSEYKIVRYNNGSTTASDTLELVDVAATLAADGVIVIANPSADQAILDVADITDEITFYNGNDALELYRGTTLIDVFGQVGDDPTTSGWTVAGNGATAEFTLLRKLSVTEGNPVALASFGTDAADSEWIVNPRDDFSNIGLFEEITDPVITANTTGFDGNFGYVANGSSSEARSYVVSAINLSENLVITAPAGFELSTDMAFTSPAGTLNIVPEAGSIVDSTIYVRFTPTAADGSTYSGDVTHTSAGAETVNLAVSGIEGELTLSTIAEARTAGVGTLVRITGIVIGGPNHSSASRVLQDETAGITLRGFDFPTADLVVGDSVVVEGTLSEFANLLQLEPAKAIEIVQQGVTLPSPQVKTLAEIGEGDESELVRVENVRFVESGLFAGGGGAGNFRVANDTGDTLVFRIGSSSHPLVDTEIPTEYVNITAWIGQFNDDYQLSPENAEDIEIVPMDPSITLTGADSPLAFGSVELGSTSAAQSFDVVGANLNVDITVTATAAYQVSLQEASGYASSVTAARNQAGEVSTTIYVRFAPTGTTTGAINGDITLVSETASATVALTGTATEAIPTANQKALAGVKAYPNPTADVIYVELEDNQEAFTYQLFNLDGRVILRGNSSITADINIANVNAGIYILEVKQEDKVYRARIAKK